MPKKPSGRTYQELSKELDEILAWFESDEIDLDEALAKYESGVQVAAELEAYLKAAENKIEAVQKKFGL